MQEIPVLIQKAKHLEDYSPEMQLLIQRAQHFEDQSEEMQRKLVASDSFYYLNVYLQLIIAQIVHVERFDLLKSLGVDVNAREEETGETILFRALQARCVRAVGWLLQNGADETLEYDGQTPLQIAENQQSYVGRMVIRHTNKKKTDVVGAMVEMRGREARNIAHSNENVEPREGRRVSK